MNSPSAFRRLAVPLTALAVLASACGSGSTAGDDPDPTGTTTPGETESAVSTEGLPDEFKDDPVAQALGAEIFNAALEEGELTIYAGEIQRYCETWCKENFEDVYGVKLNALDTASREGAERVRAENASGNQVADVYAAVDPYFYEFLQFDGLEEWKPPVPILEEFLPQFAKDPEGYFWPLSVSAKSVIVNTDLVPEDEEPKSYHDLLDPKWAGGKIAVRDPRTPGGAAWSMLQLFLHPDFGREYVEALAAQEPFITPDRTCQAVILGQFPIGFPDTGECIRDNPDAPVKYLDMEEGQIWAETSIGIIKDAPHPNAAKLFITWLYQDEQLQQYTNVSRPVPLPQFDNPNPEMDLSIYPLMDFGVPPSEYGNPEPLFEALVEIFGEQ